MTKTAAPVTALAVQGEVIEQSLVPTVEWNLDDFPTERFNRLVPTQTIAMPTDLFRPIVQVVALDIEHDTYESSDVPKGSRAIGRTGLRKLATTAGISFVDERRTDDGTNPDVIGMTCLAEMTLPTGQLIRATGSKMVDLSRQSWASAAQRAKYASFFQEHVASRAQNRAIRALLSLRASYTVAELGRPFAVVSFAPNMAHPEVRARFLDAMAPVAAQLFGPSAAPQLTAGAPVATAPEAPDDDGDPGPAGSGPPAEDPDWFAPKAEAPKATEAVPVADVLRRKVASSSLVGPATEPQRANLRRILQPLGLEMVVAGLRVAFDLAEMAEISAAQANAILEYSVHPEFLDQWREMVADGARS